MAITLFISNVFSRHTAEIAILIPKGSTHHYLHVLGFCFTSTSSFLSSQSIRCPSFSSVHVFPWFPGTVSLLSWQRAPYARHRSWLNSRVPFYRAFWLPPSMYCCSFHVSSFFGLRFIIEGCDEFKHAASAWHLLPCTTMCFRLLHKSVNLTRIDLRMPISC